MKQLVSIIQKYRIPILLFIFISAGVVVVTAQNSPEDSQDVSKANQVTLVDSHDFIAIKNKDDVFVVDVHTPEQTHIPGTDAFIPFNELKEQADQLPEDKNTPILVYCRSGGMSRSASQSLKDMGYATIYDLEGGVDAYKKDIQEIGITPELIDLGTVIYGDVETTEFQLTNFTQDEINVTNVSTSCGCTSADVEKTTLLPYESTIITVSFDPAVHENDTDLGYLKRTIYIETDHPNYMEVSARISAHVIKKDSE